MLGPRETHGPARDAREVLVPRALDDAHLHAPWPWLDVGDDAVAELERAALDLRPVREGHREALPVGVVGAGDECRPRRRLAAQVPAVLADDHEPPVLDDATLGQHHALGMQQAKGLDGRDGDTGDAAGGIRLHRG